MIIHVSTLSGPTVNKTTRLYETEGMTELEHGKHSLREGKNRIQTENHRVPVATTYSPEALITMVVHVFETIVQAASCHTEQTKCANQTSNNINSR